MAMWLAWLVFLALVSLLELASAKTWHGFWYDLGIFGAHPTLDYKSFDIKAPELNIARWDSRCEDGYVLLSPRGHFYPEPGPLIYDHAGNLIWIEKRYGMVMDLNVQRFKGQDYLTFWVGHDDGTRGEGSYYMLDSSYEVAHIVSAANGLKGDVHEFKITDQGTALMSIYEICQMDLTPVGKDPDGWVYDGLFQEIDIETGELLFQWRARDHWTVDESFFDVGEKGGAPTASDAYDYFHINSIEKKSDGTYLISSRYMHSITCVSSTGEILWILGGKRNMFKDLSGGSATDFTWQHDARWYSDNVITLLDNGANEHTRTSDHTRGMMVSLDFENMTATVVQIYDAPGHFSSHSQGNLQVMPKTGNIFIGWGKASAFTEFTVDGELLCDTHYGPSMFYWFGWVKSYRAQKVNWVGRPSYPPDIAVDEAKRTVYVSWNGATEIAGWVLQRALLPHALDSEFRTIDYVPKTGFETQLSLSKDLTGYLRVAAVDEKGEELGYTRVFEGDSGQIVSPSLLPPSTLDDSSIQEFLLAACVLAAILLVVWKSKSSLPSLYFRARHLVRRRFHV